MLKTHGSDIISFQLPKKRFIRPPTKDSDRLILSKLIYLCPKFHASFCPRVLEPRPLPFPRPRGVLPTLVADLVVEDSICFGGRDLLFLAGFFVEAFSLSLVASVTSWFASSRSVFKNWSVKRESRALSSAKALGFPNKYSDCGSTKAITACLRRPVTWVNARPHCCNAATVASLWATTCSPSPGAERLVNKSTIGGTMSNNLCWMIVSTSSVEFRDRKTPFSLARLYMNPSSFGGFNEKFFTSGNKEKRFEIDLDTSPVIGSKIHEERLSITSFGTNLPSVTTFVTAFWRPDGPGWDVSGPEDESDTEAPGSHERFCSK